MYVEPVASLAASLDDVLERWAAVPADSLSPLDLVGGLEVLHAAEAKLRALHASWLAAAHHVEATVEVCGRATRSWLVEDQCLSPAEASRRMRLARELPFAPLLSAALAAGEVNADHALVIGKVLPHIPDEALRTTVEAALVELARDQPPCVVAAAVDDVLARLGVESADQACERRFAERGVGVDETFGGTGSLNGTLTAEVRETLTRALDAASAPAGDDDQVDQRTRRQRWHDALGELAGFYLAHAEYLPAVAGERPRVVVTIDYQTLAGQLDDRWATLDSGTHLSPATVRRVACDAEILPIVLGSRSEPLDAGRTTRSFPTATRRAAWLAQNGRCGYPKCRRPPADCHHITHWANGGPSNLTNAAWLCAFHHWLVHEGSWTLRRDPDGRLVFTGPHGQTRTGPPGPRHPEAA